MTRKDVIERAIEECLNELYLRAQPSISLEELKKLHESDKDKHWYDYFYLSQKESDEIIEDYIIAYRIKNEFHDDMDVVRRYLRDGGTKDKYIKPENGSPGYRGYENTPKLSSLIGEWAAQQALNLIDECDKFYQPNREESGFRFNVLNLAPCCNIETVRKNRPDIDIYKRIYDDDCEVWREVDDNGKYIYGLEYD